MRRCLPGGVAVTGLVLIWVCSVITIQGQTAWVNPSSGLWREAGNWSAGLPDATIPLTIIENAGLKTVLIDPLTPALQLEIDRLQIGSLAETNILLLNDLPSRFLTHGTVTVNRGGLIRLENSELSIEGSSSASLNITGGTVELAGGAITLIDTARGRIGFGTDGMLTVWSGVLSAGEDLLVGALNGGDGELEILGGRVEIGQLFNVADDPGSTGTVHLAAGELIATNSLVNARIGDDGNGAFVASGGTAFFDDISIGRGAGSMGEMVISGARVSTRDISLGRFAGAEGRLVVSAGALSLPEDALIIGREGAGQALVSGGLVSALEVVIAAAGSQSGRLEVNGGILNIASNLWVGSNSSTNGQLIFSSGSIVVTNSDGAGTLVVEGGTAQLTGGTLTVDRLEATNRAGAILFSAGMLKTKASRVENGRKFVVGDGVRAATLHLEGGTHVFADGLEISAKASLTGCGVIVGPLQVFGTNSLCQSNPVNLSNPRKAGEAFLFDLETRVGARFVVEYKNQLSETAWQSLQTIEGTGGSVVISDPAVNASRFYRVRVE